MNLRKLPGTDRRVSEARASVRRQFPKGLGHQTNSQFACPGCSRRPALLRSSRRDSRHKALFCEDLENTGVAIDGLRTVRPRRSAAPWEFCRSRAAVALKVHRPGWQPANRPGQSLSLAPSLIENLRAFGFKLETDFHQSSPAHGVAQASLIFGVEHEKAAAAGAD